MTDLLAEVSDALERRVEKMGHMIAGVGEDGKPKRWDEPGIVDVIFYSPKPIVYGMRTVGPAIEFGGMTMRHTLHSHLKGVLTELGLSPSDQELSDLEEELRTHIIAGGRRHHMKGDLGGGASQ